MRKFTFTLIFFILFIFSFLPQIASISFGKSFFVRAFEKKTQANIEVGKLKLSWFGPQKFQNVVWSKKNAKGEIEELEINAPFWSFSGPFQLKNASISYMEGKVEHIEGQIVGTNFELKGVTLQGLFSLKGEVHSKLHFHVLIDVKQFPLIVINPTLNQILGPTLDLSGEISLNDNDGTIDLVISSQNLKTDLKGTLTSNAITLREPLNLNLQLNPQICQILLKEINPLFISGIEAQNPVHLRIEPKGFKAPFPLCFETFSMDSATLSLGKVRCKNGKSLQTIFSLLKAEALSNAKIMDIWFTPISLSMKNGILHASRMDVLLAHSIHICTWGQINLIKDQLNMTLGLPTNTLKSFFGIQNLDPNYVLKIQVQGNTKNPEIEKRVAAAKIAALIATPNKGVLGALRDLFSKQEKDVPPPQRPFPWESQK